MADNAEFIVRELAASSPAILINEGESVYCGLCQVTDTPMKFKHKDYCAWMRALAWVVDQN